MEQVQNILLYTQLLFLPQITSKCYHRSAIIESSANQYYLSTSFRNAWKYTRKTEEGKKTNGNFMAIWFENCDGMKERACC